MSAPVMIAVGMVFAAGIILGIIAEERNWWIAQIVRKID